MKCTLVQLKKYFFPTKFSIIVLVLVDVTVMLTHKLVLNKFRINVDEFGNNFFHFCHFSTSFTINNIAPV